MTTSLREQTWRFISATFPERQIYIRSDGRVQFFTFGPLMQTILAGITLAFLGWVAFTSVNVVFKDHIIATKDRRYQQMQASYETRVSDLQLAYDQLNSALVATADRFRSRANDLEAKHRTLAQLIDRKQALQSTVNNEAVFPATATNVPASAAPAAPVTVNAPAADSGDEGEGMGPPPGSAAPNANTPATPRAQPPATPALRPTHSGFLEGAVEKLASVFERKQSAPSAAVMKNPLFRQIAAEQARLERLEGAEQSLAANAEQNVGGEITHLQGTLHLAGIDSNTFVGHASNGGEGGPLIPLTASVLSGVADATFSDAIVRITTKVDELADMVKAMHSVPLTVPVLGPEFGLSSGFGARIDPFTKRLAFHAGLDFTGPYGSTIHSTAPGVVVYAGPRGPYGNCVEIDHGMGIKTRYGHMSAILVQPGMKVEKGTPIGRLGSSGRSTGPHVHYEVWYGDAARDPAKFIEAGRYVLKE